METVTESGSRQLTAASHDVSGKSFWKVPIRDGKKHPHSGHARISCFLVRECDSASRLAQTAHTGFDGACSGGAARRCTAGITYPESAKVQQRSDSHFYSGEVTPIVYRTKPASKGRSPTDGRCIGLVPAPPGGVSALSKLCRAGLRLWLT